MLLGGTRPTRAWHEARTDILLARAVAEEAEGLHGSAQATLTKAVACDTRAAEMARKGME